MDNHTIKDYKVERGQFFGDHFWGMTLDKTTVDRQLTLLILGEEWHMTDYTTLDTVDPEKYHSSTTRIRIDSLHLTPTISVRSTSLPLVIQMTKKLIIPLLFCWLQSAMWSFDILSREILVCKICRSTVLFFFQVLFWYFKEHGHKKYPKIEIRNLNTKSAIGLCTILFLFVWLSRPMNRLGSDRCRSSSPIFGALCPRCAVSFIC